MPVKPTTGSDLYDRSNWTPEQVANPRLVPLRYRTKRVRLQRPYERCPTRKRSHAYDPWVPYPVEPEKTHSMVKEETMILNYLRNARRDGHWPNIWVMLNKLGKHRGPTYSVSRPERQKLLAIFVRMVSDGKILRHRRTNTVSLAHHII